MSDYYLEPPVLTIDFPRHADLQTPIALMVYIREQFKQLKVCNVGVQVITFNADTTLAKVVLTRIPREQRNKIGDALERGEMYQTGDDTQKYFPTTIDD